MIFFCTGKNLVFFDLFDQMSSDDMDKIVILMELGNISEFSPSGKENFELACHFFMSCQLVLSLSSGCYQFSGVHSKFLKQLQAIKDDCDIIEFSPFTMDEFKVYKEECPDLFPLEIEVYKSITNFNPLLLRGIAKVTEVEKATFKVASVVNAYISDITKTLFQAEKFVWLKKEMSKNTNMLIYAMNETELNCGAHYLDYGKTWLHAENITYMKHCDHQSNKLVLALNFPTCYGVLMFALKELCDQKELLLHNAIIDGYYFKHAICTSIESLDVAYSKKDEAPAQQSDLDTVVFKFKSYVSHAESNLPVRGLLDGVLYCLRPCHPVIDAVAYIEMAESPWLVLIQVSLSDYKSHSSKLCDLKNSLTGVEKSFNNSPNSWLDYYRSFIPESKREDCKCVYVYVSPKEYIERDVDKTEYDIDHYNLRHVDSRLQGVYFGLILKDTDSANFITLTKEKVTQS
jgi:hypothetical protein